MSRRKKKPTRRVQVPIEQLQAIVQRTREALSADEHATLQAAVDTLARLTEELETTTTTLERVRRLIFGARSETTDRVLGTEQTEPSEDASAPNPSAAGEATATYISGLVRKQGISVSQIAQGIPMGGDLKYVDQVTLKRALETRHAV